MHLTYPNSDTHTGTASTAKADEAGTPVLVNKDGLCFAPVSGKSKFTSQRDVIINPRLNINAKIIEILEGYKSRFDYFRPIKINGLD